MRVFDRLFRGCCLIAAAMLASAPGVVRAQAPQGTAFTYQGVLKQNGSAVNGSTDMVFDLFDAAAGGNQVGPTQSFTAAGNNPVDVVNGVFDVTLDFGPTAFMTPVTDQRFLRITVNGTALSPRTQIQSAPYALQSQTAELAYSVSNASVGTAQIIATQVQRRVSGSCSGGSAISGVNQDGTVSCQAASAGTISSVNAGTGLTGGGSSGDVTLNADVTVLQHRLTGACDAGTAVNAVNQDGTVVCQTVGSGTITQVYAGNGLTGGGSSGNVALSLAQPFEQNVFYGNAIYGITGDQTAYGVKGVNSNASGGSGIYGQATGGDGVYGTASSVNSAGVYGTADYGYGLYGTGATGVYANGKTAVYANVAASVTSGAFGVYAYSRATSGNGNGVYGESDSSGGVGVSGYSGPGIGVAGSSSTGYAGKFFGNVAVTGTLSKGAGSFKIDHPLDPQNKYLYHSFVESPDMKNIYDGVATLDARGEAWVDLPAYFEALNRDFRYQLTALGRAAPSLHVADEIAGNRFRIGGGVPGQRVSWQVTGTRHDAFANANRIPVEVEKPAAERGKYLHPAAFDRPASDAIDNVAPAHAASDPLAAPAAQPPVRR